jgi:hypothetical protein
VNSLACDEDPVLIARSGGGFESTRRVGETDRARLPRGTERARRNAARCSNDFRMKKSSRRNSPSKDVFPSRNRIAVSGVRRTGEHKESGKATDQTLRRIWSGEGNCFGSCGGMPGSVAPSGGSKPLTTRRERRDCTATAWCRPAVHGGSRLTEPARSWSYRSRRCTSAGFP